MNDIDALKWWRDQPLKQWIYINTIPEPIFKSIWAKIERKNVILHDIDSKFMIKEYDLLATHYFKDGNLIEVYKYQFPATIGESKIYPTVTKETNKRIKDKEKWRYSTISDYWKNIGNLIDDIREKNCVE